MLEIHLRYVRSFLQDASRKVPPELGLDFDGVLQKISSVAQDPNASSPRSLVDTSGYESTQSADSLRKATTKDCSHAAFLLTAIDLLQPGKFMRDDDAEHVTHLFDLPLDKATIARYRFRCLRRKWPAELIDNIFAIKHPMLAFLHEQYFRETVELVYTAASRDEAIDRFLPMLHIALAVGLLSSGRVPREETDPAMQQRAIQHFLHGRSLLQVLKLDSMMALQTLTLAIVWLISTGRIAQAHPLIGLSASLALRLGLHSSNSKLPEEEKELRKLVFGALVQADIFASLVLDVPEFLQQTEFHVHHSRTSIKKKRWQ